MKTIMRLPCGKGDEGRMCYLCADHSIKLDNLAYILEKEKNCPFDWAICKSCVDLNKYNKYVDCIKCCDKLYVDIDDMFKHNNIKKKIQFVACKDCIKKHKDLCAGPGYFEENCCNNEFDWGDESGLVE